MQNEHFALSLERDHKIAIKKLEEILAIEVILIVDQILTFLLKFPNIKEIYGQIDNFINFAKNLDEYLSSSLKKIFLGEGIVVEVSSINHYIQVTENLFKRIFSKHQNFFEKVFQVFFSIKIILKYEEIKKYMLEIIENLKELINEIIQATIDINGDSKEITDKIYQKNLVLQQLRLKEFENNLLI